jgi:hypothetical protein
VLLSDVDQLKTLDSDLFATVQEFKAARSIWVCLKMGYTPTMALIIKLWGTFLDTAISNQACHRLIGAVNLKICWAPEPATQA